MNIAFVTTKLFGRPTNGGEMCSARLIEALLRAGHRLHVIGRGARPLPGDAAAHLSFTPVGEGVTPFDALPRWRRAIGLMRAYRDHQASTVQRLNEGDAPAQVRQELARLQFGRSGPLHAVVVDHLQVAAWLHLAPDALPPMLLMMHNLEAQGYTERAQRAAAAGQPLRAAVFGREARLLRALEHAALRQAASVACLSEGDAAALREAAAAIGAHVEVHVLPGFPLTAQEPSRVGPGLAAAQTSDARPRRIGLLGTWTWGPNRDGLEWMLRQVLPLLPPTCELLLAGDGLSSLPFPNDASAATHRRVHCLGRIADVQSFYETTDVVALPSWTGSGAHEKSIEALARARVVVATPHALRGMGPSLPVHVHVARDAPEFASLCARAGPGPDATAAAARWAVERRVAYDAALARCLSAIEARVGARATPANPRPQARPSR